MSVERRPWTSLEASLLRQAVLQCRDRKACRKRWYQTEKANFNSGSWTQEEDQKLKQGVDQFGTSWVKVAVIVGTRNGDQCLKRWGDSLNPQFERRPWTEQEDNPLLQAVSQHGGNWSQISSAHFRDRSALSLRHRAETLRKRLHPPPEQPVAVPTLFVNAAEDFGTES
ncbi:MAG: hypothetical protein M1820_010477 [Bogoriella megaspora]|nr:MAG: hypothetical protein M1820_010477 [Bogoriella megaspora]